MLDELMLLPAAWQVGFALVLGLLVGSFLNVLIHRLPLMLEQQWQQECAVLQGQEPQPAANYNLFYPPSVAARALCQLWWRHCVALPAGRAGRRCGICCFCRAAGAGLAMVGRMFFQHAAAGAGADRCQDTIATR